MCVVQVAPVSVTVGGLESAVMFRLVLTTAAAVVPAMPPVAPVIVSNHSQVLNGNQYVLVCLY